MSIQKEDEDAPELPTEFSWDIDIGHRNLLPEQKAEFDRLITGWQGKWNVSTKVCTGVQMKLFPDPTIPPLKQRYFPLSPVMQKVAAQEVDRLLAADLIEPSESPWSY